VSGVATIDLPTPTRPAPRRVVADPRDDDAPRRFAESVGRVAFILLIAIGTSLLAYPLFSRHNDFPVHYHPDEWSKARQLLDPDGDRNFNHPLLMLRAAEFFHPPIDRDIRQVVLDGRDTSARLAAAAAGAITIAGGAVAGIPGALLAGLAAALCPPLLVYAHYFKEEPALLVGIAVALAGALAMQRSRPILLQLATSLLLGAGVALAASGKYVGVAAVAPALVAILVAPRWWMIPVRLVVVAAVAVPLAVWINAPAFTDPWTLTVDPQIVEHVEGEVEHATTQHSGVGLPKPNAYLIGIAMAEVMPHQWAMLAVGGVVLIARRRVGRVGIVTLAFVATFAAVLTHNAIPFARYALPLTVLLTFTAAAAFAAATSGWATRRWIPAGGFMLALLATGLLQHARCADFHRQLADDSRQRLREFVATQLPPRTRIVADYYTNLASGGDPWRFPNQPRLQQWVSGVMFLPDAGTVDSLAQRFEFAVVAEPSYGRFFIDRIEAKDAEVRNHRAIYEDLFRRGTLVWESRPDVPTHSYVNPHVRVYDLRPLRQDRDAASARPRRRR
jgi:MFS family permease